MAADRVRRVLMTADTVGGVWTYAVELAAALSGHGVAVELATMGAPVRDAQRAQLAAATRRAGAAPVSLHESRWRLEWMADPWDDVARAGDWLLALERALLPDLVHLNQYAFGALPFRAPTLLVAHSCVLSWWRAVHREPAPPRWDRYRDAVRRGLHGATDVAAPTRAMLAALAHEYRFGRSGRALPNARDPRRYAGADIDPARREPVVLAAGRLWDEAKNLAALERVAPRLAWPIVVAGPLRSPDAEAAGAAGADLDFAAQPRAVRALGELDADALADRYARAAIYALPARYEPFGLSVLEAALSGCPLVLGDIASLRETWRDAALFVAPDDDDALAAALERLIGDATLRAELAQRARRRALRYTPERAARAYLAAYARIAPRAFSTLTRFPEPVACAS